MARQAKVVPVLYYALEVVGREFLLAINSDGSSQWDDHSERRRIRHPRDRFLELAAFAGDPNAFRRLEHECIEFAIDATVTQEILAKAADVALKDRLPSRYVSQSIVRDVAEMDAMLTDFFWKKINPQLGRPIRPHLS
jgi:hypothetical protein